MKKISTLCTALVIGLTASVGVLAREITIDACYEDVTTFCSDVEPGESRRYYCLKNNMDALTPNCRTAIQGASEQMEEDAIDLFVVVPHLEDREIGEANLDDDGNPVVWDHPLPFFGQDVIDLGFELPLPFGISVIPAAFEQDLTLSDLRIGLGGEADRPIDALNFDNPSVKNTALQLKFDAWLFPFMNVFATVGQVDGRATVPLSLAGADLLPERCDRPVGAPAFCDRVFSATAKPDYEGTNWSIGTTLAMGWDRFFAVLPLVYAVSDIDILDTNVDAINISPRIGINAEMGRYGDIALFLGGTYLKAEIEVAGSISFADPTSPGEQLNLSYRLIEENKDPWNAVVGGNWQITPRWGILLEAGFGGSREDVIAGITYRF